MGANPPLTEATHSLTSVRQVVEAEPIRSPSPSKIGRPAELLKTGEQKDISMGTIGLEVIEETPSSDEEEIRSRSSSPTKMHFGSNISEIDLQQDDEGEDEFESLDEDRSSSPDSIHSIFEEVSDANEGERV